MNLLGAEGGGDLTSNLTFVGFNQDSSSLAVGTKLGYRLYTFSDPEKIELNHEDTTENICIVERLFSSSLVALVSLSSPRKLKVYHFKRNTEICNYCYGNTILAVRLNRQRLVVCLEESLYIHNMRDMKVLHTIKNTPPNPTGLCALSADNDRCLLAYPGHSSAGEVQIFDACALTNKITITAHDNPLAALAFDPSGLKLATASDKGTIVRVHDVSSGQMLFEFRRGYARCATIYSLSFSSDSTLLCASSNTETVHIFKLEDPKDSKSNQEQGSTWLFGAIKDALYGTASAIPPINQAFLQDRSFAHAKLPFCGLKNVCAICTDNKSGKGTRVLVASVDGFLYIYDLNIEEGGECTLIKQHKLDESLESVPPPTAQGYLQTGGGSRDDQSEETDIAADFGGGSPRTFLLNQ